MYAAHRSLDVMLAALGRELPSDAILTGVECEAFAGDESDVAPCVPEAVVRASSAADVAATLRLASAHGVPVTPRAAGTGKSGGCVPLEGGIVLSMSRMRALEEVSAADGVAVVQPGVVLAHVHEAVEKEGLFYAPDPNSLAECTIGGNIAENAAGPRTLKYGVTRDWVLGLDVVTADGTQLSLGTRTHKGVTGYDLVSLMVGSEGTLGVVTRATLRLASKPQAIATLAALLPSSASIGACVMALASHGIDPRCIELFDERTLAFCRPVSPFPIAASVRAMLLVEIDGDAAALEGAMERAGGVLVDAGADVLVAKHGGDREKLWSVRRELSRALRRSALGKISEDVVVPRSKLGTLIDESARIGERHALRSASYGHAGDGNLHVNFLWDTLDQMPAVRAAMADLFASVRAMNGTLSGEHGIGASKSAFLAGEQSSAVIDLQQRIKATFDPRGILNPGKIFAGSTHRAC
jgi:glycolate oxidase